MRVHKRLRGAAVAAAAFALLLAACGGDATGTTAAPTTDAPVTTATTPPATAAPTTEAPATTEAGRTPDLSPDGVFVASEAVIKVDGDPSDWDEIAAYPVTLEPIEGVSDSEPHDATFKVAYDADNIYLLVTVDDDFDWVEGDGHKSGAFGAAWVISEGAGEAMGATEDDQETSLGLVDIWHWELECAAGVESGGAVYEPGEGKDPGNDSGCNFDDEYSTTPEDREDDDQAGAENSLLGVFTHSAGVNGEAGTWYFEMSRPLQTGDAMDAQFAPGSIGMLALAYWDADQTPDGWEDDGHVQSTEDGWITIQFGR